MEFGLVAGVVLIGIVHGVLPDHGWPIAATYALNRPNRWFYGTVAGLILGIGHLISSIVLVLAYFWFSSFADFAEGPWLRRVAGVLLILLGIHEYLYGGHGHAVGNDHGDGHAHQDDHDHSHGHDHSHDHHSEHSHDHEHEHGPEHQHSHASQGHAHHDEGHASASPNEEGPGLWTRFRSHLPGGSGHQHLTEEHAERGLVALGTTALLLGFAHEEPIQILGICVGTDACLELMVVYSLAVIGAILVPTLLLIAGYERHRERVERVTPYLPAITGVVLAGMGLAFIAGVF